MLLPIEDLRKADGSSFVIPAPPKTVCKPGEFQIAAVSFEHGHINGMVKPLCNLGATLKWVFDRDPEKCAEAAKLYPQAKVARCLDEVLEDPDVKMVCAADIPSRRADLGIQAMNAGKDYFTDKSPFTTLDQVERVRKTIADTGRKYQCYYGERIANESAMLAGELIQQGAIGQVIHVLGLGPHRLRAESRPQWFFQKEAYGGILTDIGSHQCEQFLFYAGAKDATVTNARVRNVSHPQYPGLEDFGEANFVADNGASFYFRVDWYTPDGLSSWGDGRTIIMGTEGTIELRKNVDIATGNGANQLYLFDQKKEVHIDARHTVGLKFFSQLIRDSLDRTELAMPQEHTIKAGELCIKAQLAADNN